MKNYLYSIMFILFLMGCSKNPEVKHLLEKIPANADFVLAGNVKTIIESAGGNMDMANIKLPGEIINMLPNDVSDDYDEVCKFLKKSGISTEAFALVIDYKYNKPIIIFKLADRPQFLNSIKDLDFYEKESYEDLLVYTKKVYESSIDSSYDDYGYIVINGTSGYWIDDVWVGSKLKPVNLIKNLIDDASEKNMSETIYGNYICSANTAGIIATWPKELKKELKKYGISSDLLSIFNSVVCLRGNIYDKKCTVDLKLFDDEGNELNIEKYKKQFKTSSRINDDIVSFFDEKDFIFYAISLKDFDWDEYSNILSKTLGLTEKERVEFNAVLSYFEKIDGTVAGSFGFTNGFESIENIDCENDVMSQFNATLIFETKNGRTEQIIEDIKEILNQSEIQFKKIDSGIKIKIDEVDFSGYIYVRESNNFIVISNHPIKENNTNDFKPDVDFSDYLSAFCVNLDHRNELMRDFEIENDIKLLFYTKPNKLETSLTLEIDGNEDMGIIECVGKNYIKIYNKLEE